MPSRLRAIVLLTGISLAAVVQAADGPDADSIVLAATGNRHESIALYREFLRLPNDANHPDDIEALVGWLEPRFDERGFETRRIETPGSPVLFAERDGGPGLPSVLVYLQADGQPVDPAAWSQDDPYEPVLKRKGPDGDWRVIPWSSIDRDYDPDDRVFARSAADSKGPMTQFLVALELLAGMGHSPGYTLKVLVDTEEELGSPHLRDALLTHRELFSADLLLIFDGPPHASNKPTVVFGARGLVTLSLVAYGPRVAQHSGHYGNFAPNPAFDLARILASMKSADGVVTIPGFYDGVAISDEERDILARVPDDEDAILGGMGLTRADAVAPSLQEALQYPSLNVRGMSAGWVGAQARTIIPPTATAELDIRLVPGSDPDRLAGLVRRHVESLGYTVLTHAPDDEQRRHHDRIVSLTYATSYAAFRSDFDSPAGRMARAGLVLLHGEEPILIRTMGGSIPIAPIIEALGVSAAIVPTVNIDNNQHSPNENLRLGSFIEGVAMLMAVLSRQPATH